MVGKRIGEMYRGVAVSDFSCDYKWDQISALRTLYRVQRDSIIPSVVNASLVPVLSFLTKKREPGNRGGKLCAKNLVAPIR